MNNGWIKLHRKILDNPICTKDSDHLAVWIYLLLNATHTEVDKIFAGKRRTLKPGQLITGRISISTKLGIHESKVQRILTLLKSEQQIEQQTSNQNRLITILNWDKYQQSEQQNEQRVNNERTTSEQRVNTNKNIKNEKNVKNDKKGTSKSFKKPTIEEIEEYCKERQNAVDPEKFYSYYQSNGWKVGRNSMKDWKAAVRTWERNNFDRSSGIKPKTGKYQNLKVEKIKN